ncbi:putative nicotinate-nucleotide adenylyltransferase [Vibrio aerogenes CECT 7868]|uniref:nicotinate-nucleotide adenylyltransferase n=1 Tax=Vibrio aerogenes CECT 7868 TaxID=1216006 RepID=A0A1M5V8C5_9VIBR|nr:nicotinate-nicotinamide nucleotide adenylyltransferase [Vibrio aerogenes]SHH71522.1 putative nicotinate-nucleotide adenylyltransferase [Vibrio aerogenes CECT 7868]
MLKIAVFGSAFNPPTLGHKSVIESLSHFDRILLVPSIAHAWGKSMLPYPVRCQLVDAFIADIGHPAIIRSDIEAQLYQPEQHVTTYAVLKALQACYAEDELTFVIGPDNLLKFDRFYKAEEILRQFSLLACPEKVQIRSTAIREQIQQGKAVSHLTTPSVVSMIQDLSLYHSDKS